MITQKKGNFALRNTRFTYAIQAVILTGLLSPGGASAQGVSAFPEAQGGGAASVGGRGGAVIEVTNLNDSGSGSLRACVEASGPRTCIFRVGGTIKISSPIRANSPYLTVAGQSAPGGGIQISGTNDPTQGLMIETHDVILRYLRIRMGSNSGRPPGSQEGSPLWIGNANAYNIIADHLSLSWTTDETVTIYNNLNSSVSFHDITLQWTALGEGLAGHSTDFITGSNYGNFDAEVNVDIHHTLFFTSSHRRPLLKNKSTHFVNNIVYNSAFYSLQALGGINVDAIGNLFKQSSVLSGTHDFQMSEVDSGDGPVGSPSIYLSGNLDSPNSNTRALYLTNPSGNQWLMAAHITGENGAETGSTSPFQRTSPMPSETFPIIADAATSLEANMMPTVGDSQRLDCLGAWINVRDAVDARWNTQYFAGQGSIPTTEADAGGFPSIASGTPCAETLHDGIPDDWKTANGLSTSDTGLFARVASNGYTNLENYLNGSKAVAALPNPPTGLKAVVN